MSHILEVTEIVENVERRVMLPLSSIIAITEPAGEGKLVRVVTMDLHRFEIKESYDEVQKAIVMLGAPPQLWRGGRT